MDKEAAVAIAKLEAVQAATNKEVAGLMKERDEWNALLKKVVAKSVLYLLGLGALGVTMGWHLPDNVRKAIVDWAAK